MRHYVLIGGGVASFAAAEAIRAQDAEADLLQICDEPHEFYSRPGLAYWLSGEISKAFLHSFSENDFRGLNLQRWRGRAERIDPLGQQVLLSNGVAAHYDRLLIATGAVSMPLAVPGAGLRGVVKLDHLEDATALLALARRARSAVVVGGGITALELVEGLVAQGVHTHYLLRGARYWSNVLDESESRLIETRLAAHGVELHFHSEVAEILGQKGRVCGVRTADQRQIACQIVAAAIGIQPRKELAQAAGLKTGRGVLVDESLRTNSPHIFAAGDVAQVVDPRTGDSYSDSLWGSARRQGQVAGINMCGGSALYARKISMNVTRLAGLTTTILGAVGGGSHDDDLASLARGDSESWRQVPEALLVEQGGDGGRLRVQVGPRTLKGAVVMGDQALSQPLQDLIGQQVDIGAVRAALLLPGAAIGAILHAYWMQWKNQHEA